MALRLRGDSRHDNGHTSRRFRYPPAPGLPTPEFEFIGNGQYEVIVEGSTHQLTVKAYTPGKQWRIFWKAPGAMVSTELAQRLPFDLPAVAMWQLLAVTALRLTNE